MLFRTLMAAGLAVGIAAAPALGQERGRFAERPIDLNPFGPEAGDWDVTFSGTGSNDRKFREGQFGIHGSLGYFLTDDLALTLRQSIAFTDLERDTSGDWVFSTRGGVDWYFIDLDRLRPFIGASFGGFYGDAIRDTFALGLQGGARWYVKPKTFLFGQVEYLWLFRSGTTLRRNFSDGQFLYTLGIGFNF